METTEKSIQNLVLDTGAIIQESSGFLGRAEILTTTPAVIAEIKDKTTRERIELTLLPFVTQRTPTPQSVKIVQEFSRRTGDLAVLSKTDIELIALTREIECELLGGDWRLRNVPGQKRTNGPAPRPQENTEEKQTAETNSNSELPGDQNQDGLESPSTDPAGVESQDAAVELENEAKDVGKEQRNDALTTLESSPTNTPDLSTLQITDPERAQETVEIESPAGAESESDSEGWITPSNIKRIKKEAQDGSGASYKDQKPRVFQAALATTDFAMQNVCLQMGLNLVSPASLQQIKHAKTFILRCHGCFEKTRDMSKQFCPRCGQPTLTRVSCTTTIDGEVRLHLKKNMQWHNRGAKYSIPKPTHGSASGKITGGGKNNWGSRLILAEDQKEYVKAIEEGKRQRQKDLWDIDALPSILSGDRGNRTTRPKVGAGKDINARRRR
jgi:RNA-binding protein NOB1